MRFGVGCHLMLIVNILFETSIFQRIGNKNSQSSVYDADREIPTLRSTDNAGNSINLMSASETDDRFFLSQCARQRY